MGFIKQFSLFFAWVVALIATLASIFIGEVLQWEPCSLCWYQRICLFPLAIILGIATYRRDASISLYLFPQVSIGFLIGLYQYLYPYIAPYLGIMKLCNFNKDCMSLYFEFLGFITLPLLSIISFLMILIFLTISYCNREEYY